jgi:hypothetical protein
MKRYVLILAFLTIAVQQVQSQQEVVVDKQGVMRWKKSNEEIKAFGINYTAMFAHAYRTAKRMNIPLEKAIDDDVYHFARLGFDAFRVHVWDCEISDSVGNLLVNDHLRLFDYALKKMKDRGMKFIITPIAYWPNGYPEDPENTPGFATKYGKDACLTNEEAIRAQEKYLFRFLNHVNEYTGVAYKNDPAILAFEISNEPHHQEEAKNVTAFINRMVKSMRTTGCRKPIFYNVSHSVHLADAYFQANIQGGTFQWYPTGLGARHELGGNLLPNVDRYTIPFASHAKFKSMARIVYEFDAADVGRSYIYPAMARSFREAGLQVATHFSYDPTFMAPNNTEYSTHYMNLVYAPQKALSLKIASEVFHRVPMYKNFGAYPVNTTFDVFKVSYEKDLAEMVSEEAFIYTNHTSSLPVSPDKLETVAGWGNSSVVKYEGTGAYFLDRIEQGVWRLEVMPDAVWVNDPFGRTSPKKEIAVVSWKQWPIAIALPDLGDQYTITALNDGNTFTGQAAGRSFTVYPGTYRLTKAGVSTKVSGNDPWKNIVLKEFSAPPSSVKKTYVIHKPVESIVAGSTCTIEATIVSPQEPVAVTLSVWGDGWRPEVMSMKRVKGYTYQADIPQKLIKEGFLRYYITVQDKDRSHTYPTGMEGSPEDWDFYDDTPYKTSVVKTGTPVYLFDAFTDVDRLSRQWLRTTVLRPLPQPGKAELLVNVEKLFTEDPENRNSKPVNDYSLRYYFGDQVNGRKDDMALTKKLVFKGGSLNDKPCELQVALIMRDGSTFGGILSLGTERKEYALSLADLKPVRLVTLPRPYPTFLPYFFTTASVCEFDVTAVESLQLSIGPGIPEASLQQQHGIAIESVRLE